MTELYPNAKKFIARNPTLIATIYQIRFYEHPLYGDESPLVAITKDGKLKKTDFLEIPEIEDVKQWLGAQ